MSKRTVTSKTSTSQIKSEEHKATIFEKVQLSRQNNSGGKQEKGEVLCVSTSDLDYRQDISSATTIPAEEDVSPPKLARVNPKKFSFSQRDNIPFQLPSAQAESFRICDDVLQDVLDEIGCCGIVFPSKRQFYQSKLHRESQDDHAVVVFNDQNVVTVFQNVVSLTKAINEEQDKKDAFLAACSLVRPGVDCILRKRREEKFKQLVRGTIGRLRPNPRRRRYSDMVSSSFEGESVRVAAKFQRVVDRSSDNAAARAAAKKLAKAKVQHAALKIAQKPESKRGRPRKSLQDNPEVTSRPAIPRTAMITRPRRSADIRNHIDWKFCYGGPPEKKAFGSEAAMRKRRQPHAAAASTSEEGDAEQFEDADDDAYQAPHNGEGGSRTKTESPNSASERTMTEEAARILAKRFNEERDAAFDQLSYGQTEAPVKKRSESILFKRKRLAHASAVGGQLSRTGSVASRSSRARSSSSDSSNAFSGAAEYYSRAAAYKLAETGEASPTKKPKRDRPSLGKFGGSSRPSSGGEPKGEMSARRHHHKHDTHRRLTLLDRVVLGLTCCVAQEGGEIHIKQLHADDLNILTQRLNETGFFIKSLALKTNANHDAEYNIVLTCAPKLEVASRQVRKFGSHGSASPYPTAPGGPSVSVVAVRKFMSAAPAGPSAQSDKEVSPKRESPPPDRPRSTLEFTARINKSYDPAALRNRRSLGGSVAPQRQPASTAAAAAKFHHPLHRLSMRNLTPSATALVPRRPRSREATEESDIEIPSPLSAIGFRRHSPRKVIRKVYTGTSTVPKILNRKRLIVATTSAAFGGQTTPLPAGEEVVVDSSAPKMLYPPQNRVKKPEHVAAESPLSTEITSAIVSEHFKLITCLHCKRLCRPGDYC